MRSGSGATLSRQRIFRGQEQDTQLGRLNTAQMKILVIDVGGTSIKMGMSAGDERLKIPSGPELTASKMTAGVRKATEAWSYDVISIGYPGPVVQGKPIEEPKNLASGWVGYEYEQAFGKP